jgi:hypothetical protein
MGGWRLGVLIVTVILWELILFILFFRSTSGYVNVYGADSFAVPNNLDTLSGREKPKMIKALGQLTTPISALRFNHDAQILAMASKDKKDAFRLVCFYFCLLYRSGPIFDADLTPFCSAGSPTDLDGIFELAHIKHAS